MAAQGWSSLLMTAKSMLKAPNLTLSFKQSSIHQQAPKEQFLKYYAL
jgi:hypothetical protein